MLGRAAKPDLTGRAVLSVIPLIKLWDPNLTRFGAVCGTATDRQPQEVQTKPGQPARGGHHMRHRHHDTLDSAQVAAMIDQFHDHIDRAVTSTRHGRIDRARAYLAAAERLLDAIPDELVVCFELAGHLTGVARGLRLTGTAFEPRTAA